MCNSFTSICTRFRFPPVPARLTIAGGCPHMHERFKDIYVKNTLVEPRFDLIHGHVSHVMHVTLITQPHEVVGVSSGVVVSCITKDAQIRYSHDCLRSSLVRTTMRRSEPSRRFI